MKKKLPLGLEGMNDVRAARAAYGLARFAAHVSSSTLADLGAEGKADIVGDLITDLGHYCDRNGLNYAALVRRGISAYCEETGQLDAGEVWEFVDRVAIGNSEYDSLSLEAAKILGKWKALNPVIK